MYRDRSICDRDGSGRPFGECTASGSPLHVRTRAPGRAAIAVFVDAVEAPWLKFLRPGFRHVFAAVEEGPSWMICDPLKDRIELRLLQLPPGVDLADVFAAQGHNVLVGRTMGDRPRQKLALAPLTCVAVVKRLLGIRAAGILTPRQLYDHLLHVHPERFVRRNAPATASPQRGAPHRKKETPWPPGAVIARERA